MRQKFISPNSSVKTGELILREDPFVYVLSSKECGTRCDNCLKKCKVLKCSECQFVYYCDKSCQRDAWTDHKWECANLKRVAPKIIPDGARMLAKIINKLSRGNGNSFKSYYSNSSYRMWKDLMSHYTDLKKDRKRMDHFTSLCVILYEFMKDFSLPNTVDLMGLFGRMVINSFTILDIDMNSIGTGIYIASSIIDHSCEPNAVATFDGKTINIRAIKDMPSLDWKKIRISYIDLMKTPYERQMELLENYYFVCDCDKCMDEKPLKYLHAAKCLNSICDNPVNIKWKENCVLVRKVQKEFAENGIENGESANSRVHVENGNSVENICSDCSTAYTDENVEKFITAMEFSEVHLQNMRGTSVAYVDVCKFCLERQEGVLHPLNVMYAQTLDQAFDALIQVQLWEQACIYAEKLLPCFRFYYGPLHPLLGLLHLKYGKILLYKMDLPRALAHFKSAEKILKITHGNNHPLYNEQLMPLLQQAIMEST
ncbi:N-lysine methyltransferase SMYD2-A isoform X1 [Leptidea sinapis]|uniref:N-lysine methyltransferase SMYD2-A isoform X1 n=2 Tax=Leptidea sinapis TaxID=189913 RepID=UPI00212D98C1|nr:N-lysine methyltransferase SMYD2-A isoform X1 [Leptidea sinapis]